MVNDREVRALMRILLVSPLCPLPLEKGGAVRIWNIAKHLSKNYVVDLVCFIRDEGEKRHEDSLKKVFNSVKFIKRRGLLDRSALTGGLLAPVRFVISNSSLLSDTLFSSRPLLSHLYDSAEMREFLLEADRSGKYSLIYAETFYGIASLKDQLKNIRTKMLLVEQNIESQAYARQADQQDNPLLKRLMKLDVAKIYAEEGYFWNNCSVVGGLSDVDVSEIKKRSGNDTVWQIDNGVDVAHFSEKVISRKDDELLFVGSLSYFQNIDALKWLIDEIWPSIKNKNVSLRIVGRGADSALKHYVHEQGLVIDESVEDIREAFQSATMLVAPIRAGSGTKYKVLESMASHLPVVTTTVGAEGLRIMSGEEALIADSAEGLVAHIDTLLQDDQYRDVLAQKAYEFVSTQYDWKSIVSRFEESLATL